MKRSQMKRSTRMASGGSSWRRKATPAADVELEQEQGEAANDAEVTKKLPAPYRRMKTKGPTMTPIRRSAKGEQCTLQIPGVCRNRTDTTVWCHSNRLADGKGTGFKAPDEAGCYGCFDCHSFLDGGWARFPEWSYEDVQQYFEAARKVSRIILLRKGLIAS